MMKPKDHVVISIYKLHSIIIKEINKKRISRGGDGEKESKFLFLKYSYWEIA